MSSYQFKNILVVKHGSLGDIAFSLIAMNSIKKHYSNAKIDLLTEKKYSNLLKKSGNFNSIIEDNRNGILKSLKIIFNIKKNNYDLIIDLQNSKRTNYYWLLLKLIFNVKINGSRSNCDIQYIIPSQGVESPQKGLYNQLKLLGINDIVNDVTWLSTDISEIISNKIILIIPCVSLSGKNKQWPPNNYAKLSAYLETKGYHICVVGQKSDKVTIENIINSCENVIDLTDKSPPEIIYSVAKKSKLIISNDTGPGHIAALSNTPILFFGIDNNISKSNLSEYENGYKILTHSMNSLSLKQAIDFIKENKLISE